MGFRIENFCVGPCPMGCIHCENEHVPVCYCDKCGWEETGDDVELYEAENGDELCWECYKEQFNEKVLDDCDDEKCSECGAESEYLYEVEKNVWVCEECLKNMAERVRTYD